MLLAVPIMTAVGIKGLMSLLFLKIIQMLYFHHRSRSTSL